MTSVLNVDTIADKAGTGPVGLTKQIALKSYSEQNNNTSGAPINQSLNQSSITDSDTGHKIHNFTSTFSTNTYLLLVGGCGNRGAATSTIRGIIPDGAWTAQAADVRYAYASSTVYDDTQAGAGFVGDLA
jgi:hypothetical protein